MHRGRPIASRPWSRCARVCIGASEPSRPGGHDDVANAGGRRGRSHHLSGRSLFGVWPESQRKHRCGPRCRRSLATPSGLCLRVDRGRGQVVVRTSLDAKRLEDFRTQRKREENSSPPSLAPPTAAEEYCAVAALERADHEEKRRCKAGGPSRIRQMGERSPKRRQEDGRVRVLRILRERKARTSRFPCRRQQMANRSWLASSRRSIGRLTPPRLPSQ